MQDGRTLVGQMIAFDKYMNLVLAECEEFRKIKQKGKVISGMPDREEKRTLGLVILRGESIVSISVEAPPPQHAEKVKLVAQGPGMGRPAGRGLPVAPALTAAPMGLGAPVPGVGGPSALQMRPGMPMPPPGFRPGMPPPPGFRPPPV